MTIFQKPFKGILAFLGIWNTPRLPWKDSNYEDTSLNHLLFFLERIPKPPPCGMYKTWKHSVGFKDFFHQLRIFLREGIQSFFETSPWNLSRSKQHKFSRKTERPCQAIAFFTPRKDPPDIGFGVASEMKSFARQIDGGVTKYGPQDPWMAYHLPAFSLCLWWLRKICHTWVLWVPRFLCLIHRLTVISFIMLIIHSMLGILPYKWMFNSEPLLSGLDCWTLSKSWNWCWPPTLSGNFLW